MFTLQLSRDNGALVVVGKDALDPVFTPEARQALGDRLSLKDAEHRTRGEPPVFIIKPRGRESLMVYSNEQHHPDPLIVARVGTLFLRVLNDPEPRDVASGVVHRDRLDVDSDPPIDNLVRPLDTPLDDRGNRIHRALSQGFYQISPISSGTH